MALTLVPDFFSNMTALERIYFFSAFIGGLLFVLRLGLMLLGGGDDGHDMGDGDGGDHHDGTDSSFRLISLHGLTGFFTMFGLVGLALVRGSGVSEPLSLLGAFFGGSALMFVIAGLTQMLVGLRSEGNVRADNAVGVEGMVYLTIPKGGIGKVQIVVQNHLKIYDAMMEDEQESVPTGGRIQVARVMNGSTLVVKKAGSGGAKSNDSAPPAPQQTNA